MSRNSRSPRDPHADSRKSQRPGPHVSAPGHPHEVPYSPRNPPHHPDPRHAPHHDVRAVHPRDRDVRQFDPRHDPHSPHGYPHHPPPHHDPKAFDPRDSHHFPRDRDSRDREPVYHRHPPPNEGDFRDARERDRASGNPRDERYPPLKGGHPGYPPHAPVYDPHHYPPPHHDPYAIPPHHLYDPRSSRRPPPGAPPHGKYPPPRPPHHNPALGAGKFDKFGKKAFARSSLAQRLTRGMKLSTRDWLVLLFTAASKFTRKLFYKYTYYCSSPALPKPSSKLPANKGYHICFKFSNRVGQGTFSEVFAIERVVTGTPPPSLDYSEYDGAGQKQIGGKSIKESKDSTKKRLNNIYAPYFSALTTLLCPFMTPEQQQRAAGSNNDNNGNAKENKPYKYDIIMPAQFIPYSTPHTTKDIAARYYAVKMQKPDIKPTTSSSITIYAPNTPQSCDQDSGDASNPTTSDKIPPPRVLIKNHRHFTLEPQKCFVGDLLQLQHETTSKHFTTESTILANLNNTNRTPLFIGTSDDLQPWLYPFLPDEPEQLKHNEHVGVAHLIHGKNGTIPAANSYNGVELSTGKSTDKADKADKTVPTQPSANNSALGEVSVGDVEHPNTNTDDGNGDEADQTGISEMYASAYDEINMLDATDGINGDEMVHEEAVQEEEEEEEEQEEDKKGSKKELGPNTTDLSSLRIASVEDLTIDLQSLEMLSDNTELLQKVPLYKLIPPIPFITMSLAGISPSDIRRSMFDFAPIFQTIQQHCPQVVHFAQKYPQTHFLSQHYLLDQNSTPPAHNDKSVAEKGEKKDKNGQKTNDPTQIVSLFSGLFMFSHCIDEFSIFLNKSFANELNVAKKCHKATLEKTSQPQLSLSTLLSEIKSHHLVTVYFFKRAIHIVNAFVLFMYTLHQQANLSAAQKAQQTPQLLHQQGLFNAKLLFVIYKAVIRLYLDQFAYFKQFEDQFATLFPPTDSSAFSTYQFPSQQPPTPFNHTTSDDKNQKTTNASFFAAFPPTLHTIQPQHDQIPPTSSFHYFVPHTLEYYFFLFTAQLRRKNHLFAHHSLHHATLTSVLMLESLTTVHAAGYVHRDIKGANFSFPLFEHQPKSALSTPSKTPLPVSATPSPDQALPPIFSTTFNTADHLLILDFGSALPLTAHPSSTMLTKAPQKINSAFGALTALALHSSPHPTLSQLQQYISQRNPASAATLSIPLPSIEVSSQKYIKTRGTPSYCTPRLRKNVESLSKHDKKDKHAKNKRDKDGDKSEELYSILPFHYNISVEVPPSYLQSIKDANAAAAGTSWLMGKIKQMWADEKYHFRQAFIEHYSSLISQIAPQQQLVDLGFAPPDQTPSVLPPYTPSTHSPSAAFESSTLCPNEPFNTYISPELHPVLSSHVQFAYHDIITSTLLSLLHLNILQDPNAAPAVVTTPDVTPSMSDAPMTPSVPAHTADEYDDYAEEIVDHQPSNSASNSPSSASTRTPASSTSSTSSTDTVRESNAHILKLLHHVCKHPRFVATPTLSYSDDLWSILFSLLDMVWGYTPWKQLQHHQDKFMDKSPSTTQFLHNFDYSCAQAEMRELAPPDASAAMNDEITDQQTVANSSGKGIAALRETFTKQSTNGLYTTLPLNTAKSGLEWHNPITAVQHAPLYEWEMPGGDKKASHLLIDDKVSQEDAIQRQIELQLYFFGLSHSQQCPQKFQSLLNSTLSLPTHFPLEQKNAILPSFSNLELLTGSTELLTPFIAEYFLEWAKRLQEYTYPFHPAKLTLDNAKIAFINDIYTHTSMFTLGGFIPDSIQRKYTPKDAHKPPSQSSPHIPLSTLYNRTGLIQEVGFTPNSLPSQIHNIITAIIHFDHVFPTICNINHHIEHYLANNGNGENAAIEQQVCAVLQYQLQQHIHSIYFYIHQQLILLLKRSPPLQVFNDNFKAPQQTLNHTSSFTFLFKHLAHVMQAETNSAAINSTAQRLQLIKKCADVIMDPDVVPEDEVRQQAQPIARDTSTNSNTSTVFPQSEQFRGLLQLFSIATPSLCIGQMYES